MAAPSRRPPTTREGLEPAEPWQPVEVGDGGPARVATTHLLPGTLTDGALMTIRHRTGTLLLGAALFAVHAGGPQPAAAQIHVGLQTSYGTASELDPAFGLGLRTAFGVGFAGGGDAGQTALDAISAVVSLERFFPDCETTGCSHWELNGNLVLPLFAARGFTPYLGAGLGITRLSVDDDIGAIPQQHEDDTDIGINLLGGVRYLGTALTTFGELRKNVGSGDDPFYVTVGVMLGG